MFIFISGADAIDFLLIELNSGAMYVVATKLTFRQDFLVRLSKYDIAAVGVCCVAAV